MEFAGPLLEWAESTSDCNYNNSSSCSRSSSSGCESSSGHKNGCSADSNSRMSQPFSALPKEIVVYIFSYLSFDEIAQLRPVCRQFDDICKEMLNDGYYKMEKYHVESLKKVKAQLPRRESERRNHRLARHGDILMAIETRLSLLGMTYGKFMDQNLCCFIPGRVIDEVRRIINLVNTDRINCRDPPRPHEVLQELRDISSMAMEHFDEFIQPRLRAKITDRLSGGITDPLIAAANLAIVEANETVMGFRPAFRIASGSSIAPPGTGSVFQTIADHARKIAKIEHKAVEWYKRSKEKDKKLQEVNERLSSSNAAVEKLNGRVTELEKQLVEIHSMLRKDSCDIMLRKESCESATSRGTKFPADGLAVCVYEPRPKRSRRDN